MKKLFAILAGSALSLAAFAQNNAQEAAAAAAAAIAGTPQTEVPAPKPNYWTRSLMTNISFGQNSYWNWAKGGNNNVSLNATIDGNADYSKNKIVWKNHMLLKYGFMYSEDKPISQKNIDQMLLESTFGYKATPTLSYSAKFTFLNQFTNGYTYEAPTVDDPTRKDWLNARKLKSGFLSPGIVTLGLGIDWVPNNWLTVNFAPLTGGFTIVTEKELGLWGENLRKNYGMELKKKYEDIDLKEAALHPEYYRGARFEFGAQLTVGAKVKINDNFEASTKFIGFSNYLKNPQNIRVYWDNTLAWNLAKYFALTMNTNLIYDDTISIVDKDHPNGHRAVQFFEGLLFGFTYTFSSKK